MSIVFITAIDTGVGKTVVTGLMARYLAMRGKHVITQKLVQTGCRGVSEDIAVHRELMGIEWTADDEQGLTCPYVLDYPASPHLAAAVQAVRIDPNVLREATDTLAARYEHVLIEGVGGIEVPLTETMTTLDYVAERAYPLVVVSSPRLGSINHTLLTLRAARMRGLDVLGIVYNRHDQQDRNIAEDSHRVFERALREGGADGWIVDVPEIVDPKHPPEIDWAVLETSVGCRGARAPVDDSGDDYE